jgi:hypothetical protein
MKFNNFTCMKSSQKSSHFSQLLFHPKSSQQEKKVANLATFRRIWSHCTEERK